MMSATAAKRRTKAEDALHEQTGVPQPDWLAARDAKDYFSLSPYRLELFRRDCPDDYRAGRYRREALERETGLTPQINEVRSGTAIAYVEQITGEPITLTSFYSLVKSNRLDRRASRWRRKHILLSGVAEIFTLPVAQNGVIVVRDDDGKQRRCLIARLCGEAGKAHADLCTLAKRDEIFGKRIRFRRCTGDHRRWTVDEAWVFAEDDVAALGKKGRRRRSSASSVDPTLATDEEVLTSSQIAERSGWNRTKVQASYQSCIYLNGRGLKAPDRIIWRPGPKGTQVPRRVNGFSNLLFQEARKNELRGTAAPNGWMRLVAADADLGVKCFYRGYLDRAGKIDGRLAFSIMGVVVEFRQYWAAVDTPGKGFWRCQWHVNTNAHDALKKVRLAKTAQNGEAQGERHTGRKARKTSGRDRDALYPPDALCAEVRQLAAMNSNARRQWFSRFRKRFPRDFEQKRDADGPKAQFIYRLSVVADALESDAP